MRASAALLAGLFLLAGCRRAEEPLQVVASPREAPSAGLPAAPSAGAVAPPPVKFVRPDDAVGYALFRARYEAYRKTASGLSRDEGAISAYRGTSPIAGARRVQVVSSANLRGRLEDCGCKSNPLGGLARRMTLNRQTQEGDPISLRLQLDAGDALFSSKEPAPRGGVEPDDALTARTLLETYGAMGVQAMALGPYDLRMGADWVLRESGKAGVAALAANLRIGDGWAPGRLVFGSGQDRVGVIGVTLATDGTGPLLQMAGIDVGASQARYAVEAERASADGAKAIVLLAAGGMEATRRFVDGLREAGLPLPALVLTSGTLQLTGDPVWAGTTPVLEAGDEGKTILRTDLFVTGDSWFAGPEGGSLLEGVRRYMTLIRSHQNAKLALLSGGAVRNREGLGTGATEQLREAERIAAALASAAKTSVGPKQGSALRNRIVPITPNTTEDPAIKQRVDNAKRMLERRTREGSRAKNGKTR